MIQKIKCKVFDCKHCLETTNSCKLKEIFVCNCECGNTNKELTMCDSYQKKA